MHSSLERLVDLYRSTFYESARCFVDQEPGCQNNWWLGVLFNLGYIISYLCAAALNEESANYNMIAFTLVSPVTVTFWLVFSSLNPNNENTPIWSVLPALALLISGTVLWKYWEFREDKKSAKSFDVQGDLEREPILRAKTFWYNLNKTDNEVNSFQHCCC